MKPCKKEGCTRKVKSSANEYCHKHKGQPKPKSEPKTTQAQLIEMSDKVGLGVNKRVSNFGISIVTNKSPDDSDTTQKFLEVLCYLYKDDNIRDFIIDKNGKPLDIKSYESLYGKVEVGDQMHRTNHHALIKVEHNNTLQIDLSRLREFLTKVFGHNIRVKVDSLGSEADSFQNYAQKHNLG